MFRRNRKNWDVLRRYDHSFKLLKNELRKEKYMHPNASAPEVSAASPYFGSLVLFLVMVVLLLFTVVSGLLNVPLIISYFHNLLNRL